MKKNFLFYLALLASKLTMACLRLLGRKGTNLPGGVAIFLCKDFLGRMPRPKTVVGITGTNGKTTVANMVEDVLEQCGRQFVCNKNGSNVDTGVASALIAESTLLGKPKKELAVFELDERSSNLTMPYIKPDLLLVTNIFRDSYKRNAHPEFIVDILNRYVPDGVKLVLNADDLMCASLKPGNPRAYFSLDPQPGERSGGENIVQDVRVCPQCGALLEWELRRYHHIGRARCPQCGFGSPQGDYRAVSLANGAMQVEAGGQAFSFPLPNTSTINVYNALSAVALLREFGLEPGEIAGAMERTAISGTRYLEEEAGGRKVILHLAKGQNPVACSRAFQNIRDYPGRKAAILFLDDYFDAAHTVENISWLYDADFEFLTDPSVTQVIAAGARHWDVYLRLLMAGAEPDRTAHLLDPEAAAGALKLEEADAVFILYDVYTIPLANRTKERVKELMEKEGEKNERHEN
ncbi:Mur ligase family protein [Acutalibacter sp. 1XD8-33]|uniref:Mur ligase family protein n=1 Tax=Acutalibacter sp. 1XD8-33 TaxID=2320081 RepID=UPI0013141B08|nr:Mur ligase family protein [Acutalibacter sp. 1XD8-33]